MVLDLVPVEHPHEGAGVVDGEAVCGFADAGRVGFAVAWGGVGQDLGREDGERCGVVVGVAGAEFEDAELCYGLVLG